MEILELYNVQETNEATLFTLKVKMRGFWGSRIKTFDCFRPKGERLSKFIDTGECLFWVQLNIDESINAILSTANKTYKK